MVTIPFERLGDEVYTSDHRGIAPVGSEITPVGSGITPVGSEEDLQDASNEDKILAFCVEPKGIIEITEHLGYKEKRTTRKYLNPLIEQGRVARTIPDKPNSSKQKYITIK